MHGNGTLTSRLTLVLVTVASVAAFAAACGDPAAPVEATEEWSGAAGADARSARPGLETVAKLANETRAVPGGAGPAGVDLASAVVVAPDAAAVAPNRKIIRSVRLEIEVEEMTIARDAAGRLAAELGGFLSDAGFQGLASDRPRGQMVLRVPAERVETAIAALRELGELRAETLGSQDVTQQYLDTETRLRVLRETDARLRRILADRTGDLADVLQVERELSRVVTEIERLEGQKRFWDEQVDLATIHVTLYAPPPVVEAGWFDPVREAFASSFGILARSAALLITALAASLPFAAVLLVGWLAWRVARRPGGRIGG